MNSKLVLYLYFLILAVSCLLFTLITDFVIFKKSSNFHFEDKGLMINSFKVIQNQTNRNNYVSFLDRKYCRNSLKQKFTFYLYSSSELGLDTKLTDKELHIYNDIVWNLQSTNNYITTNSSQACIFIIIFFNNTFIENLSRQIKEYKKPLHYPD